jgi:transposase
MYLDRSRSTSARGKVYQRILLRDSFRDDAGRVKHHTIANLSHCSPEEIQAIDLALQHKKNLPALQQQLQDPFHLRQGKSFGAIYLLHQQARRLGIADALGTDRFGQLALWQIIARALNQGSRLGAVRLAAQHALGEILDLEPFNEEHLYANLGQLSRQQAALEDQLFRQLYPKDPPSLFLYDVTSSYLEGDGNALADWGYNRDGKKGKKQIVLGLLCDEHGNALSVEVFKGNTSDTKTFAAQVKKAAGRFGAKGVTFVGDRGMIKGPQITELAAEGFHYITAITKPQIETLLKQKLLQIELFDQALAEVEDTHAQVRYALRRNPQRQQEMAQTRQSQLQAVARLLAKKNQYLTEHRKAKTAVALRAVQQRIQACKAGAWLSVAVEGRTLKLAQDAPALAEAAKLDGCYVIKTDLPKAAATAQVVHDRYKDLARVEQDFRTMKTAGLEMRPVYVRLEENTRGHALVVMLAHRLLKSLESCWAQENLTVEEGLNQLDTYCLMEVVVNGAVKDVILPEPEATAKRLLELAGVQLPAKLHGKKITVATKQTLQKHRPRRSK